MSLSSVLKKVLYVTIGNKKKADEIIDSLEAVETVELADGAVTLPKLYAAAQTVVTAGPCDVDANLSVAAQAVVTAGPCDVDANLSVAAQAVVTAGACDTDANLSVAAQAVVTAGACDIDANLSVGAQAVVAAGPNNRLAFAVAATVGVIADATFVGDGFMITIPAHTVCHGFIIEGAAPGGTAGGAKTIAYSIGTVQNADNDLTDPTDIDVMISTGNIVAAVSVHGDVTGDNVPAYFAMDGFATYFPIATNLWVNFLGQSADATANPGTVTAALTVYALVSRLA